MTWRAATFDELIEAGTLEVGDGYRAKNAELGGSELPFLRQGLIGDDGTIDFEKAERFRECSVAKAQAKSSMPHDVLVVTKGWSTGRVAFMQPSHPRVVYSPHVSYWRSRAPETLDPHYLRQWSRSPEFTNQLEALAGTCTLHPYLSLRNQRLLQITLPPLSEQQRIAAVLAALDDKIELNRQMNRTLEEIAQAVFQSWFIDFDGHDELVATELGKMPQGWEVRPFLEVADLVSGGTPKTREESYWGGKIKWASAKDVSQSASYFLIDTERTITEIGLSNSSTKIIPAGAVVVVARGATCGRFVVFGEDIAMNQTCYALVAKNGYPSSFLRFMCADALRRLVLQAHGSVFNTITTMTFRNLKVVVPPIPRAKEFHRFAQPFVERIRTNLYEMRTLTNLRDTLLPKLISGEIRIPEGEAIVEAAT